MVATVFESEALSLQSDSRSGAVRQKGVLSKEGVAWPRRLNCYQSFHIHIEIDINKRRRQFLF